MTDRPGWTFCDNPECLLCATKSPRRDVPAEPARPAMRAGESLTEFHPPRGRAVDVPPTAQLADLIKKYSRLTPPVSLNGMDAVFRAAMERENARVHDAHMRGMDATYGRSPLPPAPDIRAIFDSHPDHIHWAFDDGPSVRPARLSRLARLARLQPIWWVRDHVSAQWDWHRWLVGVTPWTGGFAVHLACLALIFERNRPARLH